MKQRCAIGVLATLLSFSSWSPQAAAQVDEAQRAFSIPERTEALRRAREVQGHLRAQRWPQAIQTLQDLLERDGDALLPPEYRADPKSKSIHRVFPGAGQWARHKLELLPRDAVDAYRQRFGASASDALERASRNLDKHALVTTASRWPLCDTAPRALWILGELELESGQARMALLAWRAAIKSLELIEPKLDGQRNPRLSALETRCEAISLRLASEREAAGLPQPRPRLGQKEYDPLEAGDLSQARTPLPSKSADGWYTFLNMWPFAGTGNTKVLYPTEHRGRVLVSNSLEVYCLDAFTGREIWHSEAPSGWELLKPTDRSELIKGLYPEMLQVQPVASGRVAVAVLQLPYSALPNRYYRDMVVMKAIPQRRLFAFDLETGAALWDHAPELKSNGRGGPLSPKSIDTYAEGMMIAATPTIVGSRVLVPSYILEGRIDYQVACYALESGELLWKTNLISGQRSRNMFGRAMREFCSSPLVVEGGRVVAQTDLGTLAALDLNTGTILWEALYNQIEQPKNSRSFNSRSRTLTWLTSKPVVQDGFVISAPADSKDLYCYDLEDGRVIWSYSENALSGTERHHFNRLLGADRNTIYLGGRLLGAIHKPGGLGSSSFSTSWTAEAPRARNSPPQLLCKEGILVPSDSGRVLYDRRDGNPVENLSAEWDAAGTPEVKGGILFTLGRDGLRGYFDWPTLLARQSREYRNNPGNYEIALASARLFTRRAEAGLLQDQLFVSLDNIRKARKILEEIRGSSELDMRTSTLLHQVLCSEARALHRKGDSKTALARLGRARKLAPHARALRDTLLQEEQILRSAPDRKAYLAILDTLEANCAAQPLPKSYLGVGCARLGLDEEFKGRMPSVGLWVLLQRAEEYILSHQKEAAFEDWSRVLLHFDDFQLSGQSASQLATQRLGQELKRPGGSKAYGSFEKRAQDLLAKATLSKDLPALDRLTLAYPHSKAASQSDQIQIEWAFEQNNRQRLANIVHGPRASELPNAGRDALLRLGRLLGQAGNEAYELGLLNKLVQDEQSATSSLPGEEGVFLAEQLDELLAQVPALPDRSPRFQGEISARRPEQGQYTLLGQLDLGPGRGADNASQLVYAQQPSIIRGEPRKGLSQPSEMGIERPIHLISFSSETPGRTNWHIIVLDEFHSPNNPGSACVSTPERVILGGRLAIHAYDTEGQLVWEHPERKEQLAAKYLTRSLTQRDGVLVAWMQDRDDSSAFIARAFDLYLGTLLWEVPLEQKGRRWFAPIMGPEHVIFLSRPYRQPVSAKVIDRFSGSVVAEYELGNINGPVERSTWIDGQRLMVPHFSLASGQKERIAVHDLLTGRELWNQALPAGEELRNIVRYGGKTFAIMFTSQPGHSGGVYQFRPEARSLRRILPLKVGERPVGYGDRDLIELDQPELFLFTNDSTLGLRLRTLDLEQGRTTWTRPLPIEATQTYIPILSTTHVGIAARSKIGRGKKAASLFLLDRRTGVQKLRIELDAHLGQASRLSLQGLGKSIYVAGTGALSSGHLLEIIDTSEESR